MTDDSDEIDDEIDGLDETEIRKKSCKYFCHFIASYKVAKAFGTIKST